MNLMHANDAKDDESDANAQVQLGNLQRRRKSLTKEKRERRRIESFHGELQSRNRLILLELFTKTQMP